MACTARSSSAIDRIVRFKTRGGTYFITPPLSLRQARKKQLQGCIRVLFEKAPSLRWEVSNLQTVTLVLPNGPPPPHHIPPAAPPHLHATACSLRHSPPPLATARHRCNSPPNSLRSLQHHLWAAGSPCRVQSLFFTVAGARVTHLTE